MMSNENQEDSGGVLTSLQYYDAVRRDNATTVQRAPGENIDVLQYEEDGDLKEMALCHISGFLPFTEGDDFAPFVNQFEVASAAMLAAQHLNTGNGILVPEMEGLNERCRVRFTVEFTDSKSDVVQAVQQSIDQMSREPGSEDERLPCAFIGEYRSSISGPMSFVTSLFDYMQVGHISTSADLDDKNQYSLFGRTIPSDLGNAVPIIQYMRNVLDVKHLAVINVNDSYGNAYVEGLRIAAKNYAPDLVIHQIPMDEGQSSVESVIDNLKRVGYRYVFALVFTEETHNALLTEAYNQGVAGTGEHNWFFGDSFFRGIADRQYEKGSPLHLAYQGIGLIEITGGVPGIPSWDKYQSVMSTLSNPDDLAYLKEVFPYYDLPEYTDDLPLNDPTFMSNGVKDTFSSFLYEAVAGVCLAACGVTTKKDQLSLTGREHFDAFRKSEYQAISGKVNFNPETGTRDPNGALYRVENHVAEEFLGVDGRMYIRFNPVLSDLYLDGNWTEQAPYIFNDGTTNVPPDLAPVSSSSNASTIGLAIGLPVFALMIIGVLVFLFYENKRKESDNVWRVDPKHLKFDDPPTVIGRGTFGVVTLAEYRGTQVAVKKVIPPKSETNKKKLKPGAYFSSDGLSSEDNNKTEAGTNSYTNSDDNSLSSSEGKGDRSGSKQSNVVTFATSSVSNGHKSGYHSRMGGRHSTFGKSRNRTLTWSQLKREFVEEMSYLSKLRHPNITTVMGAVIRPGEDPMLIMEYMDHGSLYDILHNETMFVEGEMLLPILRDISQGVRFLRFLHSAVPQVIHGDLKAANILVDNKFRAKVADFGLSQKKTLGGTGTPFWMAPELLRLESANTAATDVYSFGVILYEVYSRRDPYEGEGDSQDILDAIADKKVQKRPPFPPGMPSKVKALMSDCLEDDASKRPTFDELDNRLKRIDAEGASPRTEGKQQERSTISLFDLFPRHIAEALRDGKTIEPEHRESVTIFFSDIVGFTNISAELPPRKVAHMLDRLYSKLDSLCQKYSIFKVETIGDAYMCATNLVKDQSSDHAKRIAAFAIEAVSAASATLVDEDDPERGALNIRVGFHSGSVVADVVGTRNPRYCLFGDTVNTASRMESNSKPNRINCSAAAALLLRKQWEELPMKSRGDIAIKGKGTMRCYWVNESAGASGHLTSMFDSIPE